jgi:hypothetical protein
MTGQPSLSPAAVLGRLKSWHRRQQEEKQLVEDVVDAVDPRIKIARGYRKQLKKPIQACLAHCRAVVMNIPGPIQLKFTDFDSNPLIAVIFLGSSIGLKDLIAQQDSLVLPVDSREKNRVALLTMAHNETTVFGAKREGEMIVGDARMQSITFTDHKIVGLSTNLEESRDKLEKVVLHIILETVSREIAALRTDVVELRAHRERLQAMSKMFSGGRSAGEYFGHDSGAGYDKLEKIERMLAETEKELIDARAGNDSPEDWLKILAERLEHPEKIMGIKPFSIRLDWSNTVVGSEVAGAFDVRLAQCRMSEERKREAVLIAYSVE